MQKKNTFDSIQYPFMIKKNLIVSTEGTNFNVVKNIYDKPRAESTYDSEKINTFLINSRQGCLL